MRSAKDSRLQKIMQLRHDHARSKSFSKAGRCQFILHFAVRFVGCILSCMLTRSKKWQNCHYLQKNILLDFPRSYGVNAHKNLNYVFYFCKNSGDTNLQMAASARPRTRIMKATNAIIGDFCRQNRSQARLPKIMRRYAS